MKKSDSRRTAGVCPAAPQCTAGVPRAAFLVLLVFAICASATDMETPQMAGPDRIRISEAIALEDALGHKLWENWPDAPFSILLVTNEHEFLIGYDNEAGGFSQTKSEWNGSKIYFRKRTQPVQLLATFPLLGISPVIVIGQPENTLAKTSTNWVLTLLHEHFHQLQMSRPDYFKDVDSLELSNGDQTGMWMLNYAFPYDSAELNTQLHSLAAMLRDCLIGKGDPAAYFAGRKKLRGIMTEKDYRYFSFQLWQEGIARYTEYKVADWAAKEYSPTQEFQSLSDYESFRAVADRILNQSILNPLAEFRLKELKREGFYPLGAAEGLLLDKVNHDWRSRYFQKKFYLEEYVE